MPLGSERSRERMTFARFVNVPADQGTTVFVPPSSVRSTTQPIAGMQVVVQLP